MIKKIKRHPHSKSGKKLPADIKYTRDKLIYQYRQEGWTLTKLATLFGLTSRERVRQIIQDFENRKQEILRKVKKNE